MAARGHQVTVVASQVVEHGPRGRAPRAETWKGVEVRRTPAAGFGKQSLIARVADYSSYILLAALRSATLPQFDVVLALTTPPLLPLLGVVLRRLRSVACVALIEDVYPDIAVRTGHLEERSLLTRSIGHLVRRAERQADRVIVIGRCMRDVIARRGVDPARIDLIPNWADGRAIHPLPPDANPLAGELGLDRRFTLVYSGNMGWGHDLDTILDAARRLPEVTFAFFGDGHRRRDVERAAATTPLGNIRLYPYQPRERLVQTLNLGPALISQRPDFDGLLVPSKLYAALAAGQPVLFVGRPTCEVGLTITEERCGYVIPPRDVDAFVNAVQRLRRESALREAMSRKAREAFERRFQRHQAIDAYERVLLRAVAEYRARVNPAHPPDHQSFGRAEPSLC
jgi:glycosyltransferase involved in cell wall biosynthesis